MGKKKPKWDNLNWNKGNKKKIYFFIPHLKFSSRKLTQATTSAFCTFHLSEDRDVVLDIFKFKILYLLSYIPLYASFSVRIFIYFLYFNFNFLGFK